MARNRRRPARLGQVLNSVLARRKGLRNGLKSEQIFLKWPDIVGADLSEKLYPLEVKGKTLIMAAISSTWAQEAAFLTKDILENIQDSLGKGVVNEIRVQVHGSPRGSRDYDRGPTVENPVEPPAPPDLKMTAEDRSPEEMLKRLRCANEYMKTWRESQRWPLCPHCKVRYPPSLGEEVCPVCRRVQVEQQQEQVRALVEEAPWMTPEHLMHETGVDVGICRPIRNAMETYWRARIAEGVRVGSSSSRRFPHDFRRRVLQMMMFARGDSSPKLNPQQVDEVCGPGVGKLFFDTE